MDSSELNRREALKSLAAMTAAIMAPAAIGGMARKVEAQATQPAAQGLPSTRPGMQANSATTQPSTRDRFGELLPQRRLGKTGAMVTMLGLGGSHVGQIPDESEAQKVIETAIAGGVRFFDTAVAYQKGGSESRLGRLLTPRYRDVIFLMTKTTAATAAEARTHLDDSLRRLNTDYVDLWQMHSVTSADMVDDRIRGGVLDVFLEAQQKGKVRYLGFTGHATPNSHLHMLDLMKERNDPLQTCQMPINVADPNFDSFVVRVLPKLIERGFGVCAMKTLANGGFTERGLVRVIPNLMSAEDCMRFAWSLPISVLISGPASAAQYGETISYARRFKVMEEEERQRLIKLAGAAGKAVEYYKA